MGAAVAAQCVLEDGQCVGGLSLFDEDGAAGVAGPGPETGGGVELLCACFEFGAVAVGVVDFVAGQRDFDGGGQQPEAVDFVLLGVHPHAQVGRGGVGLTEVAAQQSLTGLRVLVVVAGFRECFAGAIEVAFTAANLAEFVVALPTVPGGKSPMAAIASSSRCSTSVRVLVALCRSILWTSQVVPYQEAVTFGPLRQTSMASNQVFMRVRSARR